MMSNLSMLDEDGDADHGEDGDADDEGDGGNDDGDFEKHLNSLFKKAGEFQQTVLEFIAQSFRNTFYKANEHC